MRESVEAIRRKQYEQEKNNEITRGSQVVIIKKIRFFLFSTHVTTYPFQID